VTRVTIAQLTDIHVWDDADLHPLDFVTKRATGWFNHRFKRRREYDRRILEAAVATVIDAQPDLVVVSGDLSNLGLPSEYAAARRVLQPIADAGIRITVIPGNHDYYLPSCSAGRFESAFGDWQRADAKAERPYPFLLRVGPVRVLLFNSAIATAPMLAYGRVDDEQLAIAAELVLANPGGPLVVALHHHPIRAPHKRIDATRDLKNAEAFRGFCIGVGAAVVMHGHNHYHFSAPIGGHLGPLVVGISSATTRRHDPPQRRAEVGFYELDEDGLRRAFVRRWSIERDAFADVVEVPLVPRGLLV
jgi:3',5'-cyclic AMP phosphodiesterase CpdA